VRNSDFWRMDATVTFKCVLLFWILPKLMAIQWRNFLLIEWVIHRILCYFIINHHHWSHGLLWFRYFAFCEISHATINGFQKRWVIGYYRLLKLFVQKPEINLEKLTTGPQCECFELFFLRPGINVEKWNRNK